MFTVRTLQYGCCFVVLVFITSGMVLSQGLSAIDKDTVSEAEGRVEPSPFGDSLGERFNSTSRRAAMMYIMQLAQDESEDFDTIIYPPQLDRISASGTSSAAAAHRALKLPQSLSVGQSLEFKMGSLDISELEKFNTEENYHDTGTLRIYYGYTPEQVVVVSAESNGEQFVRRDVFVKQHTDQLWYVLLPERTALSEVDSSLSLSDAQLSIEFQRDSLKEVFHRHKLHETFAKCAGYYIWKMDEDTSEQNRERNEALFIQYYSAATAAGILGGPPGDFDVDLDGSVELVKVYMGFAVDYLRKHEEDPISTPLIEPFQSTCSNTHMVSARMSESLLSRLP